MKLSRTECIEMIERAGMEVQVKNDIINAYRDRVLYKGERVGTVYYDSVSLSPHYDYDDDPVRIQFKDEPAAERLEKSLKLLVDYEAVKGMRNPDAERELRIQRVKNVRKYFQDRKDAETILSQPTYDYEKLIKQLTKLSTEENLKCC
jgi:hypothetical protein